MCVRAWARSVSPVLCRVAHRGPEHDRAVGRLGDRHCRRSENFPRSVTSAVLQALCVSERRWCPLCVDQFPPSSSAELRAWWHPFSSCFNETICVPFLFSSRRRTLCVSPYGAPFLLAAGSFHAGSTTVIGRATQKRGPIYSLVHFRHRVC